MAPRRAGPRARRRRRAGRRRHVDRFAELEVDWPAAAAGEALLHDDLRADNLLLDGDRVWFVDWAHASIGAAWADLLFMLPSMAMQGGVRPAEVWSRYPAARSADPDAVTCLLTAVAGYFVSASLEPPPVGLPRIREFQRAQGAAALSWLLDRLCG